MNNVPEFDSLTELKNSILSMNVKNVQPIAE